MNIKHNVQVLTFGRNSTSFGAANPFPVLLFYPLRVGTA
jgi:hypothetical protein